MKFSTSQQKLRKQFEESIDSVRRRIPLYRIVKRFAWFPVYNNIQTVWLEDVYIIQELQDKEGFHCESVAWVDKKFSTKEEYEQYLKDITDGK